MFDINTYRKETKLKDGTKILLRPMVAEDQDALYEFYSPGNGCYTGLYQRFQSDMTEFCRHLVTRRDMTVADLFRAGLEL